MKKFAKEQIEMVKNHCVNANYPVVTSCIGGRTFRYYILPQSLNPGLPSFAMCLSGDPQDGYVVGVADTVNPEFRDFWAFHEYFEATEGRTCQDTLRVELDVLPNNLRSDYLAARKTFFNNLVTFATERPNEYSSVEIAGFRESASHLEKLL